VQVHELPRQHDHPGKLLPVIRRVQIFKKGRNGLHEYGRPLSTAAGQVLTVQESSTATHPMCWLRIGDRVGDVGRGFAHLDGVRRASANLATPDVAG